MGYDPDPFADDFSPGDILHELHKLRRENKAMREVLRAIRFHDGAMPKVAFDPDVLRELWPEVERVLKGD